MGKHQHQQKHITEYVTILQNQQVKIDRFISKNIPAVIICDIEKRPFLFIDTAISGDKNVIKKEAETILKYEDPPIQIQR
jgi:hypothetical protein